jgi:hypothetical protein
VCCARWYVGNVWCRNSVTRSAANPFAVPAGHVQALSAVQTGNTSHGGRCANLSLVQTSKTSHGGRCGVPSVMQATNPSHGGESRLLVCITSNPSHGGECVGSVRSAGGSDGSRTQTSNRADHARRPDSNIHRCRPQKPFCPRRGGSRPSHALLIALS